MAEVINWAEAMEQCGEDEEFLLELLDDLRSETNTQMEKIEDTIKSPEDSPFVQIMRASHVIKGAASNLMCGELRQCAMKLETAASSAANESNGKNDTELLEGVKGVYEDLKVAVENYQKYLEKIGV